MAPLGDVDESEWEVASGDGSALALPPAIEPAERDALLAQLVAAFTDREQPIAQSPAQALSLARELGRLLDELAIEGISFDRLEGLVEGNFASHWQRTLKFLAIVGEALASGAGRTRPDRRHRAAHPGDPRPGDALARATAGHAGDRRRLHRLAAGHARAAVGHRRPAAGQDRAAGPRPRHGRSKLDGARRDPSAVRPARAPEGAGARAARRCRLAGRRRLGAASVDHRADAPGRDHRGMGPPARFLARARDARRLRDAASGGIGHCLGVAPDPAGRAQDRRPGDAGP